MTERNEPQFGDDYYNQQRKLYGVKRPWAYYGNSSRAAYKAARDAALADPEVDFFDSFMPTGRSKHDIGRYALRNGVRVPLIDSIAQLHEAAATNGIIIRSDGRDEYDGPSGLRESPRLVRTSYDRFYDVPREKTSLYQCDDPHAWIDASSPYYYAMPPEPIRAGADELVLHAHNFGERDVTHRYNRLATEMILSGELYPGAPFQLDAASSSLWRIIPGDNIMMMRDPVQEGLYHFKWGEYTSTKIHRSEYDEGYPIFPYGDGNAKNLQRRFDYGTRGYREFDFMEFNHETKEWSAKLPMEPKLWAPIHEAIDMYEKVRTLPLFDQRQVPVMEMQYDRAAKELHFLQYLKTGRVLQHLEAFPLPVQTTTELGDDVIGATAKEGDTMRLYVGINSRNAERARGLIKGEGVVIPFSLILDGSSMLQSLALESRVAMLEWMLTFHNHHFGSAMVTRTPVSVGLDDSTADIKQRIHKAYHEQSEVLASDKVGYINATVTSNGRNVAVDSDWQIHPAED